MQASVIYKKRGVSQLKERIQANLKMVRQVLKLSVSEMSEMLGVSRQTVYNIESGKAKLTQAQSEVIVEYIKTSCEKNSGLADILKVILQ